jgi:cation diffusion facilitator CzcD-associated flavoprotein CzcO
MRAGEGISVANPFRAEDGRSNPESIVRDWLARFEETLVRVDASAASELLASAPMWRDVFALTWDLTPIRGRDAIAQFLADYLEERPLRALELDAAIPVTVDDDGVVLAMFSFRTDISVGRGVLRLVKEQDEYRAWTISTELRDLIDHPRHGVSIDDARRDEWNRTLPAATAPKDGDARTSRRTPPDYTSHDPDVLIIGGGQAGLILAARLTEDGLDALVVDEYARAGDSWRQRYDSLKLHDSKWFSTLPYLPYPPTWPLFTPKDAIADWLEVFVWATGINLWTESPAANATYDAESGRWEVTVVRRGEERRLHPRHLVLATGFNRLPVMPTVPGSEDFGGLIAHSSSYRGNDQLAEKRVLVVGTGSSGMDIAKDAWLGGAEVTLLQRGATYVLSTRHGVPSTWGTLYSENSPEADIADSLGGSVPLAYLLEQVPQVVRSIADEDKELLHGLEAAGFRTTLGPGDTGALFLSTHKGGGFHIDSGACDLIISGKIAVTPGSIARFTSQGVVLHDGTALEADAVIFATGFANMREGFRQLLGAGVTDDVATVWGLDEGGELRTTFRHSGHERLWVFAGNIGQCRYYSRPVAVMIKAIERGLLDANVSVEHRASDFLREDFTPQDMPRVSDMAPAPEVVAG